MRGTAADPDRFRGAGRVRGLTVALTAALSLAACSSTAEDKGRAPSAPEVSTPVPEAETQSREPDPVDGQPILIQTRMKNIRGGEVLPGSLFGDASFCRGGKVRAEHGTPDIGLVHSTFSCRDGQLSIGFSPMQHSFTQSSPWKVVDSRGRYEGLRGGGWMVARFDEASGTGRETFTGTLSSAPGTS